MTSSQAETRFRGLFYVREANLDLFSSAPQRGEHPRQPFWVSSRPVPPLRDCTGGSPGASPHRKGLLSAPPTQQPSGNLRLAFSAGCILRLAFLGVLLLFSPLAKAGGSGLNVLVVANSASPDSLDLANYYLQRRQIPPQNLLLVRWTGGRISWNPVQFNNILLQPILAALRDRGLSNQIDFVVLSMDFPYRIATPNDQNSTTSALFYGFKTNAPGTAGQVCRLAPDSSSRYYGSETIFREGGPDNTPGHSFLATMITGDSLAQAKRYVDRAVAADGTAPTNRIILAKTSDAARNVRFRYFDNTIFDVRILGGPPIQHLLMDSFATLTGLGGLQTGLAGFSAASEAFVPGSLADSLTSFGGQLFETSGQTSLLAFLEAGAAGSYGTVAEPCNYLEKFPDPLAYLYQMRGFSLAESYYQSLVAPYQGIVVGEPLSAPFRRLGSGAWLGLVGEPGLAGVTNLGLSLSAPDPEHPVQKVDLFLDGVWLQTVTNIQPQAGSQLVVNVNGNPATYTVPEGATLRSVTTGLGDLLNEAAFRDVAQVDTYSYGDRIELQSLPEERLGSETTLTASSEAGTAGELTVFLRAAQPAFLDTIASGWRSFVLEGTAASNDVLQVTLIKTNAESIRIAVTNAPSVNPLASLVQTLMARINAAPGLTGMDGVAARDLFAVEEAAEFNLFARGAGRESSQIQVAWTLPEHIHVQPGASQRLDERPNDLQPRNHLYLAAGKSRVDLLIPLDTTLLSDGFHELRAVAYEGTSMATQTHVPIQVRISNTGLEAACELVGASGPVYVGDQAQVRVSAGPQAIRRIDLFTTGGRLAGSTNESISTFTLRGDVLGAGSHSVYALVTDTDGRQYRTAPAIVTFYRHPPIRLTWSGTPAQALSWTGEMGFRYEILSADALEGAWRLRDTILSGNGGLLTWSDPELAEPGAPAERFYQVRGLP